MLTGTDKCLSSARDHTLVGDDVTKNPNIVRTTYVGPKPYQGSFDFVVLKLYNSVQLASSATDLSLSAFNRISTFSKPMFALISQKALL